MSSTHNSTYLSSSDLNMLEAILSQEGLLQGKAGERADIARRLIRSLFHAGKKSSAELSSALRLQMKRTRSRGMATALHRYAIQGLPVSMQAKPNLEVGRENPASCSGI
ncbi:MULTISPECIES: hypothetical protein [Rhizobium/Agrobacterium group]|jgi:hypothetical protein|uniref:hypothetical protein n=1 Tax=Rhizobium/Agrobacterium group TaxID=227290 RepID=UPI00104B09FA|nr:MULTISPECIES: hypothetical protein [Rhizobium/Agrobacterium group]